MASVGRGAYDSRVDGLRVGDGSLGGKGVYATRDFEAGETVVDFELTPLTGDEFAALEADERIFVHSYSGRRWLYPPPARWVNHADDPSCYQDFERSCDIALRPIAAGDAVTIDATQETDREVSTFLDALVEAQQARDPNSLGRLLSPDVVLWEGCNRVRGTEQTAANLIAGRGRPLLRRQWHLATGRWEALCSIELGDAHLTLFLRVLDGNWQLAYAHRG
jgi:hypothetical protein